MLALVKKDCLININWGENFIQKLASFIAKELFPQTSDFSRLGCVFGGRRPGLFLLQELGRYTRGPYFPPKIFSVEEFVDYLFYKRYPFANINNLDALYHIYNISKKIKKIVPKRETFGDFFSWAKEIISFLETLELEDIREELLLEIEKSADIGYDVPQRVNELLKNINFLRREYYSYLKKNSLSSRGQRYKIVSSFIEKENLEEFKLIIFCNLLYPYKTERKIIETICGKGKGLLFLQTAADSENYTPSPDAVSSLVDECKISAAADVANTSAADLSSEARREPSGSGASATLAKEDNPPKSWRRRVYIDTTPTRMGLHFSQENISLSVNKKYYALGEVNYSLYEADSLHTQIILLKNILESETFFDKEDTVIVLPRAETLICLLAILGDSLGEFNVSLGYPLKRTSFFSLFNLLFRTQESKENNLYYSRDYLNLLRHPLVKNLSMEKKPQIMRVLVHKIEEAIEGYYITEVSAQAFINLSTIEEDNLIYSEAARVLGSIGVQIDAESLRRVLKYIHRIFFKNWEDIYNFKGFSQNIKMILDTIFNRSSLLNFPLHSKFLEKIYNLVDEFSQSFFSEENFSAPQMWDIFIKHLESEFASFSGSPLCGVQVLGLYETRCLSFKNVIILDVNEGVLPKLKVYEPLLPREVMLKLGLRSLEVEEQIQKYHFYNLISSAERVYLIYEKNNKKERSRFIEEMLWQAEKKRKKIISLPVNRLNLPLQISRHSLSFKKTKKIVSFLKKMTYSASALDVYLTCPLKFYWQYCLGLKEKENLIDEPSPSAVGTFIHSLLKEAFSVFKNKKPLIDKNFQNFFLETAEKKFEKEIMPRFRSGANLLKKIIILRLKKFLENEKMRKVKKIIYLEEIFKETLKLAAGEIEFKYIIDRVDEMENNQWVVIDYKTGGGDVLPRRSFFQAEVVEERIWIRENIRSLQLPLYAYYFHRQRQDKHLQFQIYNIRTLQQENLFPSGVERKAVFKKFITATNYIFKELLDARIPFLADEDISTCQHCSFINLCRR